VAHSLCRRSSCSASVSRANALDGSRSDRGTQIQLPRTWTRCGLGCRSDHDDAVAHSHRGSADLEGRPDYAVTMPEPTGTSVYGAVNAEPSRSGIPRGYAVSCVCVCSQEPLPSHSKCGGRKPMGVRVPPPPLEERLTGENGLGRSPRAGIERGSWPEAAGPVPLRRDRSVAQGRPECSLPRDCLPGGRRRVGFRPGLSR
jgi:hypothetical protein